MRANRMREIWQAGGAVINGWCSIPNSFSAEIMAHIGWDSLVVDLQHGVIDYQAMVTMLQGISTTNVVPIVRVPWNDPAAIMKALDAGAYAIICPMINTQSRVRGLRRRLPLRAARLPQLRAGPRDVLRRPRLPCQGRRHGRHHGDDRDAPGARQCRRHRRDPRARRALCRPLRPLDLARLRRRPGPRGAVHGRGAAQGARRRARSTASRRACTPATPPMPSG